MLITWLHSRLLYAKRHLILELRKLIYYTKLHALIWATNDVYALSCYKPTSSFTAVILYKCIRIVATRSIDLAKKTSEQSLCLSNAKKSALIFGLFAAFMIGPETPYSQKLKAHYHFSNFFCNSNTSSLSHCSSVLSPLLMHSCQGFWNLSSGSVRCSMQ